MSSPQARLVRAPEKLRFPPVSIGFLHTSSMAHSWQSVQTSSGSRPGRSAASAGVLMWRDGGFPIKLPAFSANKTNGIGRPSPNPQLNNRAEENRT